MELTQTFRILPVHFLSPAIGIGFALAGLQQFRRQAFVLPPIDQAAKLPRGPALFIDPRGLNELLQQPKLIVRVKDREIALQSRQFGMATKHFRPDGMKCAKPGHALHRLADNTPDALPHFSRGLVGEGNGQYFGWPCLRSEEHTSELQSLMRISYAVLCF